MNQATTKEQLINDAIILFNNEAINFEEFNELLAIIQRNEEFASTFIKTLKRISKQTRS